MIAYFKWNHLKLGFNETHFYDYSNITLRIYNDDKAVIESFCDYIENSPSHFKDAGVPRKYFQKGETFEHRFRFESPTKVSSWNG